MWLLVNRRGLDGAVRRARTKVFLLSQAVQFILISLYFASFTNLIKKKQQDNSSTISHKAQLTLVAGIYSQRPKVALDDFSLFQETERHTWLAAVLMAWRG